MAAFWVLRKYLCTALGMRPGSIAWAPKQVAQSLRSGFTAVERMSGSPQPSAVAAPPASNADIDPTAANASSQALV